MTKEELEKEAREYLAEHSKYSEVFGEFFVAVDTLTAMLDFAEPREKQIQIDAEQIRALQKQNGELTDENERLKGNLELWESGACRATNLDKCGVVKELEAQIEKMQDDIDCLTFACENYREEMEKNLADATELEKENAELKADNDARKFAMAMS